MTTPAELDEAKQMLDRMSFLQTIRLHYHTMKLRALCWALERLRAHAEKLARP